MSQKAAVPFMRRLALSFKAVAPGQGRHLAGKDFEGNLYFEKPDPNGKRRETCSIVFLMLKEWERVADKVTFFFFAFRYSRGVIGHE